MHFKKPFKTIDEQIELLCSRGIVINDLEVAKYYLSHINYYRLSGYWLLFEKDHQTHQFREGTKFEDILNLYQFDRELRLIVLDAIERIEVSLRARWSYFFAQDYGSHCFMNSSLFRKYHLWEKDMKRLENEINRSNEDFILHYKNKYSDPDLPPIWVISEVISFGSLSRWYDNLKPMKIRKAIASEYDLDNRVLASFLRHLTEVRNVCAHHSRLWNRKFTVTFQLPKHPKHLVSLLNHSEKRKLYNTLIMLNFFLDIISPRHSWKKRLLDLMQKHKIDASLMGFPKTE